MAGSRRVTLLAMVLAASLPGLAWAERYLINGIPLSIEEDQLTLATKSGPTIVPLPKNVAVFVSEAIPLSGAEPGDTIAVQGRTVAGAGTPTLETYAAFFIHRTVPEAAREALARRFLTPQRPDVDGPFIWSGVVSKPVEGGVEFRRGDGSVAVVRPGSEVVVGRLQPGSRADLPTGRLRVYGSDRLVTAIIVTLGQVPPPFWPPVPLLD